jgi:uncharacterized protein (DUF1778 family)
MLDDNPLTSTDPPDERIKDPIDLYADQAYIEVMSATKDNRLHVRLSAMQDELVRKAADAEGETVSEFVVGAITGRARDVLADQRVIKMDDAAWVEFQAQLDAPPVFRPNLAQLMASEPDWRK